MVDENKKRIAELMKRKERLLLLSAQPTSSNYGYVGLDKDLKTINDELSKLLKN